MNDKFNSVMFMINISEHIASKYDNCRFVIVSRIWTEPELQINSPFSEFWFCFLKWFLNCHKRDYECLKSIWRNRNGVTFRVNFAAIQIDIYRDIFERWRNKTKESYSACNTMQLFSSKNICFLWSFFWKSLPEAVCKLLQTVAKTFDTTKKVCHNMSTEEILKNNSHTMNAIRPPPKFLSILYYTILYYTMKSFCFRNPQKLTRNPLILSFLPMKTLQFDSFCFRNSPETHQKHHRNTIDLAKIVWIRAMKSLDRTINVEIESDDDKMITEIPVNIRRQISFEQLDSLISNNIATKTEFRIWNAMKKAFMKNSSNFSL